MGFDIDSHGFQPPGQQRQMGEGVGPVQQGPSRPDPAGQPSDRSTTTGPPDRLIPKQTGGTTTDVRPAVTQNNPTLAQPSASTPASYNAQVNRTIHEHNLPNGRDLQNNVSPETHNRITRAVNSMDDSARYDIEMRRFFDMLSKLYPLSSSILSSIFGAEGQGLPKDFSEKLLTMLAELAKSLGKNIDSLDVPKELKAQLKMVVDHLANLSNYSGDPNQFKGEIDKLLQTIRAQLAGTKQENQFKELTNTIKGVLESSTALGGKGASLDSNSELFQKLQQMGLLTKEMLANKSISAEELKSLMAQLQSGSAGGTQGSLHTAQSFLHKAETLLAMLGTLKAVPDSGQRLAFSTLLANQSIQSPNSQTGLIGPTVDKFTNNIGNFLSKILESAPDVSKGFPIGREGSEVFSNAFKQMILSAAILGNMIAGKGGKEMGDDVVNFALVKLNSTKDLGIVDQIPFSFMAFFADLSDDGDDYSDAVKTAKQSILQLIRILLKLVFILVAIASAGKKLGKKGMDAMLEENAEFLTNIFDTLIFALRKVDENYVVNVSYQVSHAQEAKDALALKDYDHFWDHVIKMFAPKSELAAFLEDMEDAQPLFKTIKTLISESDKSIPINITS